MQKVFGYMLTWTTYGSWLQGDRRKYVKDGQILEPNQMLENSNKANMSLPRVLLNVEQRRIIEKAIFEKSILLQQKIAACSVGKNHVHVVTGCHFVTAAKAVSHYKNAARLVLRADGFKDRLWTRGYSVRYCLDENEFSTMTRYVERHNKKA